MDTYPRKGRSGLFIFLAFITLLAGCSETRRVKPPSPAEASAMMSAIIERKAGDTDPCLALFRNPLTRGLVSSFFIEAAGDKAVALPILKEADRYGIPLPLAFSLAWGESGYQIQAVNINPGSVDRGLFQLNSRSFPLLKENEFFDPELNARLGLAHLRFCLDESDNEVVALAMYNAGRYGVQAGAPYATLNHVGRILEYKVRLEERFLRWLWAPLRLASQMMPPEDS